MSIPKLKYSARVTEVETLARILLSNFLKDNSLQDDKFLRKYMLKLEQMQIELSQAIKQDRLKSNIKEMDRARDVAIRNLADMIDGYAASPIAEHKSAAIALQTIFNRYGREITTESALSKGALIKGLLLDLAEEEARENVVKLEGIGELIVELKSAQEAFSEGYAKYTAAQADEKQKPNASELKKPVLGLINEKFVPYLTALVEEEEYRKFAGFVEQGISTVNRAVGLRRRG